MGTGDGVTIALRPDRVTSAPEELRPVTRPRRSFDPVVIALFATSVSLAGAARPSLWFDEAATITASTRSLADLCHMLDRIDAVHGLYYLLMHGWFAVFPATEFWCRVPSGLAVGGAAAGIVVLTRRFSSRSIAVCAGLVFAILPRTTWAGIEARSYAFSALAAVWLTVLLITATRRRSARLWVLYAVALLLSILLNLNMVLLIPVYAVVVALLKPPKQAVIWWAATTAAVTAAAIPYLVLAHGQIYQIAWMYHLGSRTFGDVLVQQYFDDSLLFAFAAAAVLALATLFWCRGSRRPSRDTLRLTHIALVWITIPTAVQIGYSAVFEPVYYPRYLYFTAPAAAIVLASCITTIAKTPMGMACVLTALAVAAAPNYLLVQRGPFAKEGMDYSQVADVISAHAADGDCLALDNTITWLPGAIRALTAARPEAYERLHDPGRVLPAVQARFLWDGQLRIEDFANRLRGCRVIWTITDQDDSRPGHERGGTLPPGDRLSRAPTYRILHRMGFHAVERWQFSFAQVAKLTRINPMQG